MTTPFIGRVILVKMIEISAVLVFLLLICTNPVFAQSTGFTVTSVSTSDIFTKTTEPSSVYWIVNTQFNGGGQSIVGIVDPDTVKNFMGGKAYTTQPLSIQVNSVNEQVDYEVVNEGVPIYKYSIETYQGYKDCPLGLCYYYADADPCPSGTNWDIPLGRSTFGKIKTRYCITKTQVGTKGVYNNPTIGFNAKIKVAVGSKSKESTICSGSTTSCEGSSVSFGDLGVATWSGSLVTGESPPNQNNYVAINSFYSNKWQIASRSKFDSYYPKISVSDASLTEYTYTLPEQYTTDEQISQAGQKIVAAVSPTNQAADVLLNEDTSFTTSQFSTKDDNTGKVSVTLKRSLTSPNVVFRIRADWLGIYIPSGKPQILSVTSDKFQSGETGTVSVRVQNIGDAQGSFSALLVDCDPFIVSSSAQTARKTLQSGDIDTIEISINGGTVAQDLSKSCSVKVYDVNDPSVSDTKSLSLQMENPKICAPGTLYAEGNLIKKCNKDGSAIDTIETCQYGVIDDGHGGFNCAPAPTPPSQQTTNITELKGRCTVDSDCDVNSYCNSELHVCVYKSGCLTVLNQGDSGDKVDVVFVGDGYFDNSELKNDALYIIDYDGNDGGNGLMSVEPFNTNRNKFNFWMIKAGDTISLLEDNGWKFVDRSKALEVASQCTMADQVIVLSKDSFRSYAFGGGGEAYLSLTSRSRSEWGRLFLHEFGHSFGSLADEYVEPSLGDRPHQPNCAPDMTTAQSWWGGISGTGFYQGCSYAEDNYRPTFNSIMRAHWIIKDDYGPVNRLALSKLLGKYQ
jgi:hypothetical protein